MSWLRIIHVASTSLLISWLVVAPICWILRDGLLGAKATSGWEAVIQFLTTYHWGFVFVALAVIAGFSSGLRKAGRPKSD